MSLVDEIVRLMEPIDAKLLALLDIDGACGMVAFR